MYRRIYIGNLSNYNLIVDNLDDLITFSALIKGSNGFWTQLPYSSISGTYCVAQIRVSNNSLTIGNTISAFNNSPLKVILEYTKTTDEATIQLDTQSTLAIEFPTDQVASMPVTTSIGVDTTI